MRGVTDIFFIDNIYHVPFTMFETVMIDDHYATLNKVKRYL